MTLEELRERKIEDIARECEMGAYIGTSFILDRRVVEFGKKVAAAFAESLLAGGADSAHVHRWVGRGEYGSTEHGYMCADCGIDKDDAADSGTPAEATRLSAKVVPMSCLDSSVLQTDKDGEYQVRTSRLTCNTAASEMGFDSGTGEESDPKIVSAAPPAASGGRHSVIVTKNAEELLQAASGSGTLAEEFCGKLTPWNVGCLRRSKHDGPCRPYTDEHWKQIQGDGTPATPSTPDAEAFWSEWSRTDAGHTAIMRDAGSEIHNFAYLPRLFAEAYAAPLRQQLQAAQQECDRAHFVNSVALSGDLSALAQRVIATEARAEKAEAELQKYHSDLADENIKRLKAEAELASLKAAGEGWIPCAERLPEIAGKSVQVRAEGYDVPLTAIYRGEARFSSVPGFYGIYVTHWRTLLASPAKPAEGPATKEDK